MVLPEHLCRHFFGQVDKTAYYLGKASDVCIQYKRRSDESCMEPALSNILLHDPHFLQPQDQTSAMGLSHHHFCRRHPQFDFADYDSSASWEIGLYLPCGLAR